MVGNAADAEDLLQDIFLSAHRKLESFRGESALGTWLYRLAVNLCLDYLRSRTGRAIQLTDALDDEPGLPDASSRGLADRAVTRWISNGPWPSFRSAAGRRSCCTTSRGSSTARSARSWGSRKARRSLRYTRRACGCGAAVALIDRMHCRAMERRHSGADRRHARRDPRVGAAPHLDDVRRVPRARRAICGGSATSPARRRRSQPPDHIWLQIAGRLRQEGRVHDQPGGERAPRTAAAVRLAGDRGGAGARRRRVAAAACSWCDGPPRRPAGRRGQRRGKRCRPKWCRGSAEGRAAAAERRRQAEGRAESDGSSRRLPTAVAGTLDRNLQILDQAIAESSAALQQEPQNVAARNSLFDALQRKISLLQDTITLMNEMRKGNAAGVAQVVEVGNKS